MAKVPGIPLLLRILLLLLCVFAWRSDAATMLYSISGDSSGVPRQLNQIDPYLREADSLFLLGDGSIGFTGGLTWLPAVQRFYTIYDNGQGGAFLASFGLSGGDSLLTEALALSAGFWRGLTYAPDTDLLYALYSNGSGAWDLLQLDPANNRTSTLLSGIAGGFGGMTWVAPGQLTALFTNAQGAFQLHHIDLGNNTVTPFGNTLFGNMNGGLAWDSDSAVRYFSIGSDAGGYGSLYGVVADGIGSGSQFGLGGGYFYSNLAFVPDTPSDSAVPEPSAAILGFSGLVMLALAGLYRRRNRTES